jgi:isoamylase
VYPDGVNFSVYSKNCRSVELLLFDHVDDAKPAKIYHLDPAMNRTFHYCHAFVPGLKAGQIYAYRVHGPYAPEQGKRFDGTKILLDPYGRSVAVPRDYRRKKAYLALTIRLRLP